MSVEVKIPAVGESIASGVVSVWHKKSGDHVRKGEPLFTLETDKVSTEIVAVADGVLETRAAEGQEVKIGEVVAEIDDTAPVADAGAPAAKPEQKRESPLSPAVRRIVEEEKLDPSQISGAGKGGRITKGDALAAAKRGNAGAVAAPVAPVGDAVSVPEKPAASPTTQREKPAIAAQDGTEVQESLAHAANDDGRITRKRMSPLRRKIAQQLVMAQQTAAILTTFNECDMSEVQALRANAQESFTQKHGIKLGFMSFFIKATVVALKTVPSLNGRIEGEDFVQNNFYDIGVAVGTERGLVVPVLRNADKKSFADLERDIAEFAKKAREGKLKIEELQGGTFTISNGGIYGSLLSTPILNPPQSGILGMHKIMERPIAVNGAVVVRPMMYLALSYDHRAVDGKEAVTFLIKVKEGIESPKTLPIDF
ncbi:MAG: dihydrolipoyllysine succinyltransferase [Chthoniobacterales bacterium]|nr:MAG: dihydrolipoyllysine succinyltransferase [Chthoniobacterales bacterium]